MTVLDPSGRPWDSTPKRYIITTSHRVRHDPVLNGTIEQAQLNQSRVYDQVLEHFDRHAAFPFQAPAGKPSLCKWITSMRRRGQNFRNIPVALARGAASQARLAWLTKDSFEQDKAGTILDEQEKEDAVRRGEAPHPNDILDEQERKKHEPSPRLVRLWSKEPKPNRSRDRREAPCGSSCRARQSGNGSGMTTTNGTSARPCQGNGTCRGWGNSSSLPKTRYPPAQISGAATWSSAQDPGPRSRGAGTS